ncbi:glycosyltransferase family 4 protein [Pontibacter sp. SGAir0037]|uniref:glycosyltransferase family 4 protein n=1 Tax=Pontibacter sp. SGAir0037 TaxID=2571030 RepID=UPI0010CD4438|nr:glycosyltransferase family 4 protein [Pontibacter sp. SGAir0037]QCR22166.1 hypothetical protein C1N53_07310 [Pontibacter sp. SGAir0037]
MKRLLFLTSNNLATNPRLVKELRLAENQFECTVFSFDFSNWSDPLDEKLRSSLANVVFNRLSASKKPLFTWLLSSVIEKAAKILYPLSRRSMLLNAFGHSKRSFLLWVVLKWHKPTYDLVIAHNLASLYPAYIFAKKNKIPFAFDVEDYHPGEKIVDDFENERSRRIFLMKQLLPAAAYISYASPLIGEETLKLIKNLNRSSSILVNNSFSTKEFAPPVDKYSSKLHFVWFSQHIAAGRGLEHIIPALYKFKDSVQITLIGKLNSTFFKSYLQTYSDILDIQEPKPQSELHKQLGAYDVGLAFESGAADFNRDICLTNKMFAYVQAGLFVIATNTKGQTLFLKQNPWCGMLTGVTSTELNKALKELIAQKQEIRKNARSRFENGKTLAWENEEEKLLNLWKVI